MPIATSGVRRVSTEPAKAKTARRRHGLRIRRGADIVLNYELVVLNYELVVAKLSGEPDAEAVRFMIRQLW